MNKKEERKKPEINNKNMSKKKLLETKQHTANNTLSKRKEVSKEIIYIYIYTKFSKTEDASY